MGDYHTYVRPHVAEFLRDVRELGRVAVWTSSSAPYAKEIIAGIFPESYPLEFVWARDRCTLRRDFESDAYVWIKNLKKVRKLDFRLERVLMIDDSPEKLRLNYGNAIYVRSWFGDLADDELLWLAPYLKKIKDVPNFRALEKRFWRKEIMRDS